MGIPYLVMPALNTLQQKQKMILHKEYHKVGDQEIKFTISFNRDRYNWATNQPKKIGYQVSAIPVNRTQRDGYSVEESGAFTGFNDNLLEVDRQSKKRLDHARLILAQRLEMYLAYFEKKEVEA